MRIPPAQISPADEPNGTVAAGAANAAIGGRGRRRRSSTVAASINAVLDQKGPPPAEARAPSDVRAGPRRLRATGRQRQGAEPHSGAANRTSTTGTAMGAGCARTSTPTCVLLPRSVCPVGPLHSSSSRSSLTCLGVGCPASITAESGRGLIRHTPRSHPPCSRAAYTRSSTASAPPAAVKFCIAWQFDGSGAASIPEPSRPFGW